MSQPQVIEGCCFNGYCVVTPFNKSHVIQHTTRIQQSHVIQHTTRTTKVQPEVCNGSMLGHTKFSPNLFKIAPQIEMFVGTVYFQRNKKSRKPRQVKCHAKNYDEQNRPMKVTARCWDTQNLVKFYSRSLPRSRCL